VLEVFTLITPGHPQITQIKQIKTKNEPERPRPGRGWKFENLRAYSPLDTKPTQEHLGKGGYTLDNFKE
jgi:hypothetical protein